MESPIKHGNILVQEGFIDAAEWSQEIAQARPNTFHRIAMNFAHSVFIVISSPFTPTGLTTHFQARLSTLAARDPYHRRAIVLPDSMSPDLVGSPTRWIVRIGMLAPFFTRILVHLIGFDDCVAQGRGGKDAARSAVEFHVAFPAVRTINAQCACQMFSRHALSSFWLQGC